MTIATITYTSTKKKTTHIFKFPIPEYEYAICGGPGKSVHAANGLIIFGWLTQHNVDPSDNKKATWLSEAPSGK